MLKFWAPPPPTTTFTIIRRKKRNTLIFLVVSIHSLRIFIFRASSNLQFKRPTSEIAIRIHIKRYVPIIIEDTNSFPFLIKRTESTFELIEVNENMTRFFPLPFAVFIYSSLFVFHYSLFIIAFEFDLIDSLAQTLEPHSHRQKETRGKNSIHYFFG